MEEVSQVTEEQQVQNSIVAELGTRSGYERLTYFEGMARAMAWQAREIGEYDAEKVWQAAARELYELAVHTERIEARKEQD